MEPNESTETTHDPGSQSESIAADSAKGSQQGSNTQTTEQPVAPTGPSETCPKVSKPAKNKPIKVKRKRKFRPVGSVGEIETVEGFEEAMRDLNTRVPWFQENPIKASLDVKDTQVPPDLDWDDGKAVHAAFPPWKLENGFLLGTRQIPRCFLLDATTVTQKLVVVNWWKNMTKAEQAEVVSKENIHRFYRAPMRSNSPYKFWHDGPDKKGTRVQRGDNNGSPSSSDARGQPGRPRRVFGAPIILKAPDDEPTLGFRMAACCQDLAVRFNLTVDQLYCATIDPDNPCSIENCPYPAFLQNRTFCCLHKQNWWPRTGLEHYRKRRGHLLLGPEYTVRPFQQDKQQNIIKTKVQPTPCGCSDLTCEGIGWSADMARVPRGYDVPDIITPNAYRDKDRPLRLAPWHFSPEHRVQLSDGTWQLDLENKSSIESFPSPDYDPKAFLEEPEMVEYQRRKNPFLLPEWVFEMCSKEEGPFTLQELHVHTLREQREALFHQITQRSAEYEELSREHSRTALKLEELRRVQQQQNSSSPQKRSLKRSASSLPDISNQQPYRRRLHHGEADGAPADNRRGNRHATQEGNSGDESEEDNEVPRQSVAPRLPRHPLHSPTANLRVHPHFQHPTTPHGASHLVPPHLANQLAHHHHQHLPPHLVHQHRSILPQQEGGASVLHAYREHEGAIVHEGTHAMHYLQHPPGAHIPPSAGGGATGHSHAHSQVQPQQAQAQQQPQTPNHQIHPNATTYYPIMGENTPTGVTRTPPANNTGDIRGRWGFGYHR